jgi:glycosyltransferase involved in cell wall biosynthesis
MTYNHENFIIQHLESIKYQINKYGDEKKIQLIVSDDCSKDNTIILIKKWLEINNSLFERVDILTSESNLGICNNYVKGIKQIKGEYFKVLAGDDLYGSDNIFEALELLKRYDIIISPIAPFSNDRLSSRNKLKSKMFLMYDFSNRKYKKIRNSFLSLPMTPGIFIRKELLNDQVLSFIEQFKFIEDRSRNIILYENNSNLKIGIIEKFLILYRHHDSAVTKTSNTEIVNAFNEDSRKLFEYVINTNSSFFIKIKIKYQLLLLKVPNRLMKSIMNFEAHIYKLKYLLKSNKYNTKMSRIISQFYEKNNQHINSLMEEAKRYE